MRDEKEERKKQARSNKQTRQSNTAHPRQYMIYVTMSPILASLLYNIMHPIYTHTYIHTHVYVQINIHVDRVL